MSSWSPACSCLFDAAISVSHTCFWLTGYLNTGLGRYFYRPKLVKFDDTNWLNYLLLCVYLSQQQSTIGWAAAVLGWLFYRPGRGGYDRGHKLRIYIYLALSWLLKTHLFVKWAIIIYSKWLFWKKKSISIREGWWKLLASPIGQPPLSASPYVSLPEYFIQSGTCSFCSQSQQ